MGTPTRAVVPLGEVSVRVTWVPSRRMRKRMSPLGVGVTVSILVRVPVRGTASYAVQPGSVGRTPAAYADSAYSGPPFQAWLSVPSALVHSSHSVWQAGSATWAAKRLRMRSSATVAAPIRYSASRT